MAKPSLGKGLGSLINSRGASPLGSPKPQEEKGEQIETVALPKIVASPLQPRTEFKKEQLHDLIESIRERGIIQPLIVRRVGSHYELIAGERRFRAAIEIGLHEVPVIIRKASDQEVLELALIENLQREGLNPIEEATAYERLAVEFHLTQEEIARRVGKSRAVVANALRLLDLDPEVKSFLIQGRLSVGHAKVLLGLKNHEEQRFISNQILRRSASVRATEELVEAHLRENKDARKTRKRHSSLDLPPVLLHLQNKLQHRFSTRVLLQHGEKKGQVVIEYYGSDDLDRLIRELGVTQD
ncbi:MAG: ParB/RepB/Spo0J family partition protein [Verrucomicrobiae bacterium]|jgi:ParB family chromosome partitioning protein|nr:ParB/RepB/Spo0J family partition protein [Verrucomicrobiae bacterium]